MSDAPVRRVNGGAMQAVWRGIGGNMHSHELDGVWFVDVNVAPQNMARALKVTPEVIDE